MSLVTSHIQNDVDVTPQVEHAEEHHAMLQQHDNLDVTAIINFFESRLPLSLDFHEHLHYKNVDVLQYVLARMAITLNNESRTGYRRCLLQYLKDLQALPASVTSLMLRNANSTQAVHIEHFNALYSAFIPTVHNQPSEQIAVNGCTRNMPLFMVAKDHNDEYHQNKHVFGYSVAEKLPVTAPKWINVCLQIIRTKVDQCVRNPTTLQSIKKGKPGMYLFIFYT